MSGEFDSEALLKAGLFARHVSNLHPQLANEPSLGLYRVQEHINSTVPKLLDVKHLCAEQSRALEQRVLGVNESIELITPLGDLESLSNVSRMLSRCTALLQQMQ